MDIFIFSVLTNFVYYCCGSLFVSNKTNKKYDFDSQFYICFIGITIISLIALLLNFFTPLTSLINSIVYSVIIIVFVIKQKFILNKVNIKFLLISSFLTFLLIIYSTVNRPDAGLYHLPYTSVINENKIIFGLSNIHSRFGHVSILQYLSAINKNHLFLENGISIPVASIVSFFYIYFFFDVWKVFKNKETINLSNFFSLLIIIYIAFKIARYSEFGNDVIAHLSFFYLISCLLKDKLKKINFNKILLISVFAFINKPTLGLIFIAPIIIFLLKNNFKKKIVYIFFSFPALLLYLWLIKNIIVSGCAVFPIKITCLENLSWHNIQQTVNTDIETQAWAKGWPDRIDQNITQEEFIKDFNWLSSWSKRHLSYILKIIIPYILVLFLIILYIKIKLKKISNENNKKLNSNLFLCILMSTVGLIFFFFLFPLYRFGYSYIITFISLIFLLIIKNKIFSKKNNSIYKFIFVTCFVIILTKQVIKIFNNYKDTHWPNIYTLNNDGKVYEKIKIKIDNDFFYYVTNEEDQLCMYSNSICTNKLVKDLKFSLKNTYKFLTIN